MIPSQIAEFIELMHAIRRPSCLLGPPGVGKSALYWQACQRMKISFIDFRLIYMDPVDMRGIPIPDLTANVTKWLVPDLFPKDGEGILLMDELTSAATATQAAAYQLTHDRRIGEYVLPAGWSVHAAGNRQNDRAVSNRMPSALVSRFNMQEIEVSDKDFLTYAASTGKVIPEIAAFIRMRPSCLMNFDPKTWKDNAPFACPRTWEYLSEAMMASNGKCSLQVMAGFVGDGAAAEFIGYLKIFRSVPTIEEIIASPLKTKVPGDAAPLYAIATALARKVAPENADAVFTYTNRLPKEFEVLFVKDATHRSKDLTNIKAFNNWLAKNWEVFA